MQVMSNSHVELLNNCKRGKTEDRKLHSALERVEQYRFLHTRDVITCEETTGKVEFLK